MKMRVDELMMIVVVCIVNHSHMKALYFGTFQRILNVGSSSWANRYQTNREYVIIYAASTFFEAICLLFSDVMLEGVPHTL